MFENTDRTQLLNMMLSMASTGRGGVALSKVITEIRSRLEAADRAKIAIQEASAVKAQVAECQASADLLQMEIDELKAELTELKKPKRRTRKKPEPASE